MKKLSFILPAFILFIIFQSSCSRPITGTNPVKESRFLMDTIVEITLYEPEKTSKLLLNELFKEIKSYENKYSRHIPDSEISRINQNPKKAVAVSEDTLKLVEESLYFSLISDGLFDISIGPLTDLWDIKSAAPRVPTEAEIEKALGKVGYGSILTDETKNTVSVLQDGMSLDTGAIAKGFITDKLVKYLEERRIQSALINLGGNLYLYGSKPNGSAWNIGIRDPYGLQGEYVATVEVSNMSVVTSGIYERFFEIDQKRYHHILNPKTGYPENNNLASVSILSPSSTLADGLSTTVFLLGLENGTAFIDSMEEAEAIFLTKDRKIYFSSGIRKGKIPFHLTNKEFTIVTQTE